MLVYRLSNSVQREDCVLLQADERTFFQVAVAVNPFVKVSTFEIKFTNHVGAIACIASLSFSPNVWLE
jgi:hypothetical protein